MAAVESFTNAISDDSTRNSDPRTVHYVMPVVQLAMKHLILTFNSTKDFVTKQESVLLLQAEALWVVLRMASKKALWDVHWMAVQLKALKKLRMVPQQEEVDRLTLRLIGALNVQTSVFKQETAVIVLGKLVSSLTMVID